MSYILLKDYQVLHDKKIINIPKGTRLDSETYTVLVGDVHVSIDKDVVLSNPEYFKMVSVADDIYALIRKSKTDTHLQLAKSIAEYIKTEGYVKQGNSTLVPFDVLNTMLHACKLNYESGREEFLEPIEVLGWCINDGILESRHN
jgi:hypothetical protein